MKTELLRGEFQVVCDLHNIHNTTRINVTLAENILSLFLFRYIDYGYSIENGQYVYICVELPNCEFRKTHITCSDFFIFRTKTKVRPVCVRMCGKISEKEATINFCFHFETKLVSLWLKQIACKTKITSINSVVV